MTIGTRLLLDTCVLLYAAGATPLHPDAAQAIESAGQEGQLFVSPVSAWEIGLLMARGRLKSMYSAIEFFDRFVVRTSCDVCALSPAILANSSFLPNLQHRDPADCLLIATARALELTLVTRDRAILNYGAEGYVKTLAC